MRADRVLDRALPMAAPVAPSFLLNLYLARVLDEQNLTYRTGTVYTTADRNWELAISGTLSDLRLSRSLAIDMESATVAANGFRYRIPNATLLCVSDKPLHGKPKLPAAAKEFYRKTQQKHISIAIGAIELAKREWPEGLPNSGIRGFNDPLMGIT
jgi:AMP nucleosidase